MKAALIAAMVCVNLTSGCATRRRAVIMTGAGLLTCIVGASAVQGNASNGASGAQLVGGYLLLPSGLFIFTGSLINLGVLVIAGAGKEPPAPPEAAAYHPTEQEKREATTAAERRANQAAAWDLTVSAQKAARAHDCATVQSLDAQVRENDADFHHTVFLNDVAIARCLTGPADRAPATP